MLRLAPKSLTLGLLAAGLVAATAAPAGADDKKERAAAFELGKRIVQAAHFTGAGHGLSDYAVRGDTLSITVKWRGGLLGTHYTSKIKVTFKTVDGEVKVRSIDYDDNCVVPHSRAKIDRLIRELNDD